MMVIEKAIAVLDKEWKKSVGNYRYQNVLKTDYEYALDLAITALREKAAREKPEPLKLEQLREIRDGEYVYDWVWVVRFVDSDTGAWCRNNSACGEKFYYTSYTYLCMSQYGKAWIAYAFKHGK